MSCVLGISVCGFAVSLAFTKAAADCLAATWPCHASFGVPIPSRSSLGPSARNATQRSHPDHKSIPFLSRRFFDGPKSGVPNVFLKKNGWRNIQTCPDQWYQQNLLFSPPPGHPPHSDASPVPHRKLRAGRPWRCGDPFLKWQPFPLLRPLTPLSAFQSYRFSVPLSGHATRHCGHSWPSRSFASLALNHWHQSCTELNWRSQWCQRCQWCQRLHWTRDGWKCQCCPMFRAAWIRDSNLFDQTVSA